MQKSNLSKSSDSLMGASAVVALKINLPKCGTVCHASWNDLAQEEKAHFLSHNITQMETQSFLQLFYRQFENTA